MEFDDQEYQKTNDSVEGTPARRGNTYLAFESGPDIGSFTIVCCIWCENGPIVGDDWSCCEEARSHALPDEDTDSPENVDLVERLRSTAEIAYKEYGRFHGLMDEAAAEIEQLRAALEDQYMLGYKTGLDDGFNQ